MKNIVGICYGWFQYLWLMNHVCPNFLKFFLATCHRDFRTWGSMRYHNKGKCLRNICRKTLKRIYRLQTLLIRYWWMIEYRNRSHKHFFYYKMNAVFYDTNNINPPKKENPLSLLSYVLNFPEAFGYFLARPAMCSIWICSQAVYS